MNLPEAVAKLPRTTQKALKIMEAPEGREYLAMVPYGWGRDRMASEAFRVARREVRGVAPGEDTYAVLFEAPEGSWVDQMGRINWDDGSLPGPEPVGYVVFRRR